MTESELTAEEAIKNIEKNGITNLEFDTILDAHLNQSDNNQHLLFLANSLVKYALPDEWGKYKSSLKIFAQASIEDNEAIRILSPLFERANMQEFTKFYFESVLAFLLKYPDRIISVLLFISSRAVQNSSSFYTYAVRTLFAHISLNLNLVYFSDLSKYFAEFIDFEPDATTVPLQELMAEQFKDLLTKLETVNIDQSSNYADIIFLNLMKFFQPFAFRFPQFKHAFLILANRALNEDQSLKLNPFRIKIMQILIESGYHLECLGQLTKILSKSLQEKRSEGESVDWDQIIVADKEIARNANYQDLLFSKSYQMLKQCLDKLKNRIAYPEIVAPVVRALKTMTTSPIFKSRTKELKDLLNLIVQNSKRIEIAREKVAAKTDINILEQVDIY